MTHGVKFKDDKLQILVDSGKHKVWQDVNYDDINKILPLIDTLKHIRDNMTEVKNNNKGVRMDLQFDEFEQIKDIDVKLMKRDENTFDAINESPFFIPTEREEDLSEFVRNNETASCDIFANKETKSRRRSKTREDKTHSLSISEPNKSNVKISSYYIKYIDSFNAKRMRTLIEEFYCFKGKSKKRMSLYFWEIFCNKKIIDLNDRNKLSCIEGMLVAKNGEKNVDNSKNSEKLESIFNCENMRNDFVNLIKIKKNEKIILPDWINDDSSNN